MYLNKVFLLFVCIGAGFAETLGGTLNQKAAVVLGGLKKVQESIHMNAVYIDAGLAQPENVTLIRTAFSDIVNCLDEVATEVATGAASTNAVGVETDADTPLAYLIFAITDTVQDIVSDLTHIIGDVLKGINDSAIIQDLAEAVIQGLLGLIQVIGNVLRKIPNIQAFLTAIGKIVAGIPL